MERRNCTDVITKMIEHIPIEYTSLIIDLRWNLNDASFKPPEETLQWHRTMQTLVKHIPEPRQDWEWEVLSIFTTKSIETLKDEVKK